MNRFEIIQFLIIFFYILVIFIVCKYFWNLMREAKKTNRYLEAQAKLLAAMASKNDVDINTISDILAQAGINK